MLPNAHSSEVKNQEVGLFPEWTQRRQVSQTREGISKGLPLEHPARSGHHARSQGPLLYMHIPARERETSSERV